MDVPKQRETLKLERQFCIPVKQKGKKYICTKPIGDKKKGKIGRW